MLVSQSVSQFTLFKIGVCLRRTYVLHHIILIASLSVIIFVDKHPNLAQCLNRFFVKVLVGPFPGIVKFREVLLTALVQSAPPSCLQSNCHVTGQTDPATSMFLQITDGGDTAPAMIDLPVPVPVVCRSRSQITVQPPASHCRLQERGRGNT